jgi:hypothetical protein
VYGAIDLRFSANLCQLPTCGFMICPASRHWFMIVLRPAVVRSISFAAVLSTILVFKNVESIFEETDETLLCHRWVIGCLEEMGQPGNERRPFLVVAYGRSR